MEADRGERNRPKVSRYYIRESVMNVEEDRIHEFKGHRNIAIEEIPPWCIDVNDQNRKTRNCISRNICGFLNSGLGGLIYLGVLDDGHVSGIYLSRYQRDHLKLSLKDTLQRFRPPVPSHLVTIDFIPCIDKTDVNYKQVARHYSSDKRNNYAEDYVSTMENCNEKGKISSSAECNDASGKHSGNEKNAGGWDWAVDNVDQTALPQEIKFKNDPLRMRPHVLRTFRPCWCDDDALMRLNHGHRSPSYVVEIHVKPPSAKDPEIWKHLPPSSELILQPIFQAEDGSIYVRRHASLARRSLQDMVNEAVEDVQRVYFPILKEAQVHLGILEALVEKIESLEVGDKENKETVANETGMESVFKRIKQMWK